MLILYFFKFSGSLNCIQVMTERMQLFNEGVTGKGINMLYSVYNQLEQKIWGIILSKQKLPIIMSVNFTF